MIKILLFLPIIIFAQVIKFSPLPVDTANNLYNKYSPLLQYLSLHTGDKYKFIYSPTYKDLLNNFKHKKVDMIILGALPYIKLKKEFKSAKPIITFLNKYNKPYYTCQIITNDKDIKSLNDINYDTKIFLTSKLSTCGYLLTEYMFNRKNKTLQEYNYKYTGSHINVVFNVTLYNNSIGDVKSSIAREYKHFIKIIDTSIKIPEFSLVINTNKLSKQKIKKIVSLLINYKKCKRKLIATPQNFYESIEKISKGIEIK